jgi:hypothetical protein
MKYWEIIADNLCKAGWNWGGVIPLLLLTQVEANAQNEFNWENVSRAWQN